MSKISKILFNKGSCISYTILTAFFTVVSDDFFKCLTLNSKWKELTNLIVIKVLLCLAIFVLSNIFYALWHKNRKRVCITNHNYAIQVEYGDLFDIEEGKIVIDFDECFTTKTGDGPADIKPNSVCGQYLKKKPIYNMQKLLDCAGVKPERSKSEYNNQVRYKPGTIVPVPNEQFLLMAFAKLDKDGRGNLTYDEYLACLNYLWKQIDMYHGTHDVYLPILGSKITRFEKDLTQQQLLDIMIGSYRLSPYKMKLPNKLHIVCKPRFGFSINNIWGVD